MASIKLPSITTAAVNSILLNEWTSLEEIKENIFLFKQPTKRIRNQSIYPTRGQSIKTAKAKSITDAYLSDSLSENDRGSAGLCIVKCFSTIFRRRVINSFKKQEHIDGAHVQTVSEKTTEIHTALNCGLSSDFFGDANIELKNDVHVSLLDRPLISTMAAGNKTIAAAGSFSFLNASPGINTKVRPSFRIGINSKIRQDAIEDLTASSGNPGNVTPFQHRLTVESLRKLASVVQSSYDTFYKALTSDAIQASTREALIKYFEQERRVLVLETTKSQDGVSVVCICTKSTHLETLWRGYTAERLREDLEDRLVTEQMLDVIKALGLRLEVEITREEAEQAAVELSGKSSRNYS